MLLFLNRLLHAKIFDRFSCKYDVISLEILHASTAATLHRLSDRCRKQSDKMDGASQKGPSSQTNKNTVCHQFALAFKISGETFKRLHYEVWLTAAWCSCGEREIIPTCCAWRNNSVVFCIFPKLSWQSGLTIFSYWYVTCSRHMEPIWSGGMSILSLIIIPQYNWF